MAYRTPTCGLPLGRLRSRCRSELDELIQLWTDLTRPDTRTTFHFTNWTLWKFGVIIVRWIGEIGLDGITRIVRLGGIPINLTWTECVWRNVALRCDNGGAFNHFRFDQLWFRCGWTVWHNIGRVVWTCVCDIRTK